MGNIKSEVDYLTNLHNEKYFESHYKEYILDNPTANLVMIDFEKFKSINDNYGHNIGDVYLKLFAVILKRVFLDSMIIRLHGDEFTILTNYTEQEIEKCLSICNKLIEDAVDNQEIPVKFGYNAGSTMVEDNIVLAKEKADFMMYHAKNEHREYQPFDDEIWQQKTLQQQYLSDIDLHLENSIFSYTSRSLFDKQKQIQPIQQICTKDKTGNSIFANNQYDVLRDNSKITQFDMHNIKYLIDKVNLSNNSIIINIDYRSLIATDYLVKYLRESLGLLIKNPNNIILSINLNGIESNYHTHVVKAISFLKELGFQICLDKYDSKASDEIWLNSTVDFVKINSQFWKQAMTDSKFDYYLKSKVEMFNGYNEKCVPIFLCVEQQNEHNYLTSFDTNDILLGGNYYSHEKKLVLDTKKNT